MFEVLDQEGELGEFGNKGRRVKLPKLSYQFFLSDRRGGQFVDWHHELVGEYQCFELDVEVNSTLLNEHVFDQKQF